jgi:hypothetical protein
MFSSGNEKSHHQGGTIKVALKVFWFGRRSSSSGLLGAAAVTDRPQVEKQCLR